MFVTLIVLTLIAAILLICVVLIQKSKGGGLSSAFAGSNQIMGVRRTNSFIEKVTWILAGAICVLAILSTFFMPSALTRTGSRVTAPTPVEQVGGNYDTQLPTAAPAAELPAAPAAEQPAAEQPAE
ncbi:MAG: preprotein translocase subunit SecG [Bacteroidales bacterium]|nr:preprotein translocase subunit SecG [Bacteroidales bacterium]